MGFCKRHSEEPVIGSASWVAISGKTKMNYMSALEAAWAELIEWVQAGRLVPENEEDIQCFLYRGIVNHLGTALGVRSKPTTDKPRSIFDRKKQYVPGMHFPDFILGDPKEVVIEIKFARGNTSILAACKKDVQKMKSRHGDDDVKRVFILFDVNPECCFLSQAQIDTLRGADPSCLLMLHPAKPSPDKSASKAAEKAWITRYADQELLKAAKEKSSSTIGKITKAI
jgi:hypothetical protein